MNDAPSPLFKPYTYWQVTVATALGSPIAGSWLMARNYSAWGEKRKSVITVCLGIVGTLLLVGLGSLAQKGTSGSSVALIGLFATKYLAEHLQGATIAQHRAAGGAIASWWRACGVGLAVMIVIFLGIIGVVTITAKEPKVDGPYAVTSAAIPAICEKLDKAKADESFAAFIFFAGGKQTADYAVNLQFSYENDCVGLDWVLRAPINLRDKDRFKAFAEGLGYRVEAKELNGVRYLRVEKGGNLQELCRRILREQYGMATDSEMGLMVSGISWP
jgi:hypothetical protein